jgi:hypothetical protein
MFINNEQFSNGLTHTLALSFTTAELDRSKSSKTSDVQECKVINYHKNKITIDAICDLLEYYAALGCSSVPTFRDNLSDPSSRVKKGPSRLLISR